MHAVDPVYQQALEELHRDLDIPADYAARRGLRLHEEAELNDLVIIAERADGRPIQLIAAAAQAWHELRDEAIAAGIALQPLSGFRSVARQAEIIRGHLHAGRNLTKVLANIAAPGFSEHHTGRALDLGTPGCPDLDEAFAQTTAYTWLETHAGEYGFQLSYPRHNRHGIVFEPWHWCWQE